jgi:hypothetical protein
MEHAIDTNAKLGFGGWWFFLGGGVGVELYLSLWCYI